MHESVTGFSFIFPGSRELAVPALVLWKLVGNELLLPNNHTLGPPSGVRIKCGIV